MATPNLRVVKGAELSDLGAKIKVLQDDLKQFADVAATNLQYHLSEAAKIATEMQDYPIHPGQKEEARQIGEAIKSSMDRMAALRGRK